jgi:hypothetical protein
MRGMANGEGGGAEMRCVVCDREFDAEDDDQDICVSCQAEEWCLIDDEVEAEPEEGE